LAYRISGIVIASPGLRPSRALVEFHAAPSIEETLQGAAIPTAGEAVIQWRASLRRDPQLDSWLAAEYENENHFHIHRGRSAR
jgi:hypothetical protein